MKNNNIQTDGTIPNKEEDALRLAFEAAMRDTFGVSNLKRTTDAGYVVPEVQMAWFTCRCGWLTGNSATRGPLPAAAPKSGVTPAPERQVCACGALGLAEAQEMVRWRVRR